MAAPIYSVSPLMGGDLVIVIFAVVVVGGMGSILGAIVRRFCSACLRDFAKVVYPQGSNIVIFVVMLIVLLVSPPACSDAKIAMASNRTSRHRARPAAGSAGAEMGGPGVLRAP